MTSLFSVRKRAEEFARAVDGLSAAHIDAGPDLLELTGLVTTLRSQLPLLPGSDFAADLRTRLVAEARTALLPQGATLVPPTRARGARQRRLVAAASAFVLIGGTAGLATAAQNALPGEALYPVKRGIDRIETGLRVSPASRGRELLGQADDRLDEVQSLLAIGSPADDPRVPATLEEFSAQAGEGASLLFASFRDDHDPGSVVAVRSFVADGAPRLQRLAETAPPETQLALGDAALALQVIDARAVSLCATCAPDLPPLAMPATFVAANKVGPVLSDLNATQLNDARPVVTDKVAVKQASPAGALLGQPAATTSPRHPKHSSANPASSKPGGRPKSRPSAHPQSHPAAQPNALPQTQPVPQPISQPSTRPSPRPGALASTQPSPRPGALASTETSATPHLATAPSTGAAAAVQPPSAGAPAPVQPPSAGAPAAVQPPSTDAPAPVQPPSAGKGVLPTAPATDQPVRNGDGATAVPEQPKKVGDDTEEGVGGAVQTLLPDPTPKPPPLP